MGNLLFFIGSSSEGKHVAETMQICLMEDGVEVEVWSQGTFKMMQSNLENLEDIKKRFDFAILILTPDDVTISREDQKTSPRDNVIFEIGFFLGAFGRQRTFVVYDESSDLKIPSDLYGIQLAAYKISENLQLQASLGPACTQIKSTARQVFESGISRSQKTPYDQWVEDLVKKALLVVCRALSAPQRADIVKLRAFIFKHIDNRLTCTHFWAPLETTEEVGVSFEINEETTEKVAVVKAFTQKKSVAMKINALPEGMAGVDGDIDDDLCFVLAAPIIGPDGEIWGTVDFDASTAKGQELLHLELSENVLFELGRQLHFALNKKRLMKVLSL